MENCNTCHGLGFVKSIRTQGYSILRKFQEELRSIRNLRNITLIVSPDIFDFITNVEYNSVLELEKSYNCTITLIGNDEIDPGTYKIETAQ